MTVSSSNGPTAAIGNGLTTAFPFTFLAASADEVGVMIDGAEVSSTAYTVALSGDVPSKGTVTFNSPPASLAAVVIYSAPNMLQQTSLVTGGAFFAKSVEAALDRQTVRAQAIDERARRSVRVPIGETAPALPSRALRANRFLAFDANGESFPSNGTGTDNGLRLDLAGSTGGSLVSYNGRTVADKLDDTMSVKDFGAVGDGAVDTNGVVSGTDDTVAIQAAITAAATTGKRLHFPAGMYRTTAELIAPNRITVTGDGFTAETSSSSGIKRPLAGTWLLFDHVNYGFYCKDDANPLEGRYFTSFDMLGTYREQPVPGAGWAPTVSSADFYIGHRVTLGRIFTLNPYIAAQVVLPGVLTIQDLRGQPLYRGIQIDSATDVLGWDKVHFWPYWSQDANVTAKTMTTASAVYVTRADGLQIGSIFSWGHKWTLEAVDAVGAGSGLAAFDIGRIYSDKAGGSVRIVSNNYRAYGTIKSLLSNSDSGVGSSGAAVDISGTVVSVVDIGALAVTRAHDEGVKLSGAAHIATVRPYIMESWDRRGLGAYAFSASDGSTINLLTIPTFVGANQYLENGTSKINLPASYRSGYAANSYSKRVAIGDDGVAIIALPPTTKTARIEFVPDNPPGAGVPADAYWVRGTASPSAVKLTSVAGITNVDLSTGVCTGTTGTDGNFRISPANDGNLYLENRTGTTRALTIMVEGA